MNKRLRMCGLAATVLALLGVCPLALAKAGQKPAQAPSPGTGLIDDNSPNKVRSDGDVPVLYDDGVDCVSVQVAGGGFYQIRTVANTDVCNGELSWWSPNPNALPTHRFLSLDFSSPVSPTTTMTPGDLDGNGTADTIEKAPARFIAGSAFAQTSTGTTTTAVSIFVLKVNADGTTTQDTAWVLAYRNQATVTVNLDGSRFIFLGQGGAALATADLCEIVTSVNPKNGKVTTSCTPVGTFDMPFFVTAAHK